MARVLLVDDQKRWREVFTVLLEQCIENLMVEECDNVDDALQKLEENDFDLAIIDLRLVDECTYDVQGLALVRKVKEKYPQTKVVLATAYPKQIGDRHQDADAFIRKVPEIDLFDISAFQEKVNSLIDS